MPLDAGLPPPRPPSLSPPAAIFEPAPTTDAGARAPLVVLLHGDQQAPATLASAWRGALRERGWSLLALACPRDLGCDKGSFWQWNGDPTWLGATVDVAVRAANADPRRVHLVGWSGGASWIGWLTQVLTPRFASVVVHGGGIPPGFVECAVERRPVYFLVGDKNPLHHLARGLREHYEGCGHEVRWDLVAGANHEGEWTAFARPEVRARVLDWMSHHASPEPTPPPGASAATPSSGPSSAPPATTSNATATPPPPSAAPVAPAGRGARSGCSLHASPPTSPWDLALAALAAAIVGRWSAQRASRNGSATSRKRSVASTCAKCEPSSSHTSGAPGTIAAIRSPTAGGTIGSRRA